MAQKLHEPTTLHAEVTLHGAGRLKLGGEGMWGGWQGEAFWVEGGCNGGGTGWEADGREPDHYISIRKWCRNEIHHILRLSSMWATLHPHSHLELPICRSIATRLPQGTLAFNLWEALTFYSCCPLKCLEVGAEQLMIKCICLQYNHTHQQYSHTHTLITKETSTNDSKSLLYFSIIFCSQKTVFKKSSKPYLWSYIYFFKFCTRMRCHWYLIF